MTNLELEVEQELELELEVLSNISMAAEFVEFCLKDIVSLHCGSITQNYTWYTQIISLVQLL